MNKRLLLFTVGMVLLFSMSSYSAENMRIAVMDFEAKNVPRATAKMVSELIRTEMINIGRFTVVERAQMDSILKEQGVQQSGCTDTACAVQVGKMLSAKKMLVGSVMKLGGRIIINGRIVDVEKGVADFSQKQDAKSEDDLYEAVSEFCEKLSKKIKVKKGADDDDEEEVAEKKEEEKDTGPGFWESLFASDEGAKKEAAGESTYEITLAGAYLMPGGKFADMAESGYGGNLGLNINFGGPVLTIGGGYYIFEPAAEWIDSVTCISGSLFFGYAIPMGSSFKIVPALGCGYMMFTVSHDPEGENPFGTYKFTKDSYNDPSASVKCSLDLAMTDSVHLVVAPVYTFFFETSNMNQLLGVEAGLNICF